MKLIPKKREMALLLISFVPCIGFLLIYFQRDIKISGLLLIAPSCLGIFLLCYLLMTLHRLRLSRIKSGMSSISYSFSYIIIYITVLSMTYLMFASLMTGRAGSQFSALSLLFLPIYLVPLIVISYLLGWLLEILFEIVVQKHALRDVKANIKAFVFIFALSLSIAVALYMTGTNQAKKTNLTSIHYAAQVGNIPEVERFLKDVKIDVNQREDTIHKRTPLHRAASHGQVEMIKFLVKQGANIYAKDTLGRIPLHSSSESGRIEATKTLVSLGSDINTKDESGETPLFLAIWKRHRDIAMYLIDNGADINCLNHGNQNPIHMAVWNNDIEMTKVLLENGSKVDIIDKKGRSILSIAQNEGFKRIEELLGQYPPKASLTD